VKRNHITETGCPEKVFTNQFDTNIGQAVSRRLPTAAARVQTRVWSCGIL
jgi:hypothetical protein